MVNEIVSLHDDEPRAGTFLISQGFNREHNEVLRLINKHQERFFRLENNKSFSKRFIVHKVPSKTAGRPVEEYLLNEQQTIFLGSIFRNTDLVLDFKERLANDFVHIKKSLSALREHKHNPSYQITRDAGKLVRKQTTDEMQRFVEYAESQGSNNAYRYYTLITKMMNGLLFIVEGKYKNLREVMSTQQLMTVSSAEQIIDRGLRNGINKKMFYKEIYKDVKSKVMIFAELHGQSHVIDDCLRIEE